MIMYDSRYDLVDLILNIGEERLQPDNCQEIFDLGDWVDIDSAAILQQEHQVRKHPYIDSIYV